MNRVCKKCGEEKELSKFRQYKSKIGNFYYRTTCKCCESKIQVDRVKKYGTKMTEEQKKNFAEYKKIWKILNRDKINSDYRVRLSTDVQFRLRKNVSRAISRALKKMLSKKETSIMSFLPYSISDLKNHIEKQFDENMSWNNYGVYWQIDHIIPQSCLPYASMRDDNFKKCWALKNLRPLEAKTNMRDGSTKIRHKLYFEGVL